MRYNIHHRSVLLYGRFCFENNSRRSSRRRLIVEYEQFAKVVMIKLLYNNEFSTPRVRVQTYNTHNIYYGRLQRGVGRCQNGSTCIIAFLTLMAAWARIFHRVMIFLRLLCVFPVDIAIMVLHTVSWRSMFVSAVLFSVDSHKPKRRYCLIYWL